jgi:hypothetical protein
MTAAARKPKPLTRSELCRELLDIELKHRAVFDRIDAIKLELKTLAGVDGKFRENFVGLGYVSVSPALPERVTGEAPVIDVGAWSALKSSRRDRLLEEGWISIQPIIKGAYGGQVRVSLHAPPQGA